MNGFVHLQAKVLGNERDSLPEVFRILLIVMIVFWHFVLYGIPFYQQSGILVTLTTLAHVAVPAFVFISGWYGIRVRLDGFLRLVCMALFYSIVGYGVRLCSGVDFSWRELIYSFAPLFKNRWWFINVYLALYLTSPILECFVKTSTRHRVYLTIALLYFMSFWLGASSMYVARLPLFWMLYLLGRILKCTCKKTPIKLYCLCISMTVVAGFCYPYLGKSFQTLFGLFFFEYTAPVLLLSAIAISLIFLIKTSQINWRSHWINGVALGVFPCYLMHENNFLPKRFYEWVGDISAGGLFLGVLFVVGVSFLIDMLCRPVYLLLASYLCKGVQNMMSLLSGIDKFIPESNWSEIITKESK